ncbi:hypothetical protein LJC61_00885 [Ruminococcaceae bacterium OttesenSCG-928-A16]|nr:hypothetical protein [Ruminococcaceae bacterium OttesenSCG-928-A16]
MQTTSPNNCPACGAPLVPGAEFCPACGKTTKAAPPTPTQNTPVASYAPPQQPPAYGVPTQNTGVETPPQYAPQPPVPPQGYSAPPQGYSAPPQGYSAPPQAGYSQPGQLPSMYAPPASGGQSPYSAGMSPYQTPPKKSNTGCIVGAVVGGVALIGAIIALVFVFSVLTPTGDYSEGNYQNLVDDICYAEDPYDVTYYEEDLEDFAKNAPKLVEQDLQDLMQASLAFVDASATSEDVYIQAEEEFNELSYSSNGSIADCADTLYYYVKQAHKNYLATPLPAAYQAGQQAPLEVVGIEIYQQDGVDCYTLTLKNNTDKTMIAFDHMAFCYDENGKAVLNQYDDNYEWFYKYDFELNPGEEIEFEFEFSEYVGLAIAYPYIMYIEYQDGAEDGLYADWMTPEITTVFDEIKPVADAWAVEAAAAGAPVAARKQSNILLAAA